MPTFIQENHRLHRIHRHEPPRQHRAWREIFFLLLKCVIMVVTVAFFLSFLGFAAIFVLYVLVLTHAYRRRRTGNPPAAAAATTTTTTSTVLKVQNSLIDVTYTASSFPNTKDCAICLESFVEEDECRSLQTCKHLFHTECMDNWVERKLTCPICRTRVFLYPGLSSCSRISFEDRWKMFYLTVFEDDTYY